MSSVGNKVIRKELDMSYMKKALTLVACGCICLVITTSASAEFTGAKSVNKVDEDTDFLCFQGNGVDVTPARRWYSS